MVILITDGPPCGLMTDECLCRSQDLWTMMKVFEQKSIQVVVIGVEPSVITCDDFYCALANRTGIGTFPFVMHGDETIVLGGEYLPLINAARVLRSVIKETIFGEETLTQLFRHLSMASDIEINSSYRHWVIQDRARAMMTNCQTMAQIRKWLYSYCNPANVTLGLPFNARDVVDDDDDDDIFECHSPRSNGYDLLDLDCPTIEVFASSPITDDEGYRSRLPTTASSNTSFVLHYDSSPRSYHTDLDWLSDIDFEDL